MSRSPSPRRSRSTSPHRHREENLLSAVFIPDIEEEDRTDEFIKYLKNYEEKCQRMRDAYDIHAVNLMHKHNCITIPLLIITSATSVIAGFNDIPRIAGVIVGASSAVLTAIQRYCSYAELAENSRMTAKSHSKIIRKIDNLKVLMHSKYVKISSEKFTIMFKEIQADIDSTHENAKDIPWNLMKYTDTLDAHVCCMPVLGNKKGDKH